MQTGRKEWTFVAAACWLAMLAAGCQPPPSGPAVTGPTFASTAAALEVLKGKTELKWEASKYLKGHRECVPELERLVETKHPASLVAMFTLTGIGGDEVVAFYVGLLARNLYETDATGQRIEYGYGKPGGCCKPEYLYGQVIVTQLGQLRSKRAEPVLRMAWADSDPAVRHEVPKALYDIEAMTRDELFDAARQEGPDKSIYYHALELIAREMTYDKPDEAIAILRRITDSADAGSGAVESAHFWLIGCYEAKKQYDSALEECRWITKKSQAKNLVEQMPSRQAEILRRKE
jgi:hypothetical protein